MRRGGRWAVTAPRIPAARGPALAAATRRAGKRAIVPRRAAPVAMPHRAPRDVRCAGTRAAMSAGVRWAVMVAVRPAGVRRAVTPADVRWVVTGGAKPADACRTARLAEGPRGVRRTVTAAVRPAGVRWVVMAVAKPTDDHCHATAPATPRAARSAGTVPARRTPAAPPHVLPALVATPAACSASSAPQRREARTAVAAAPADAARGRAAVPAAGAAAPMRPAGGAGAHRRRRNPLPACPAPRTSAGSAAARPPGANRARSAWPGTADRPRARAARARPARDRCWWAPPVTSSG